jgi:D-lactate dehydrogenase (cytochrome)
MRHPGAPSPETLELLTREFGADLLTAQDELAARSRDDSGVRLPPAAVLLARSTAQVARLLSLANERLFAVVPRGAGTGLAGGCLAETGGVVLDLSAMNRILSIDCDSVTATVEPGVLTGALRSAAKDKGLFYPPDPASLETSTIGGNAATNAGGPACVKYGTTRDYVLGLTAVLPTGEVVRTGRPRARAWWATTLTRLLVGSEGTLGVITQLTLKLLPHPQTQRCLAAVFPGLDATMGAVIAVMTRGHLPAAMEFLDARCLKLVGDLLPEHVRARLSGGGEALALMECDGAPDEALRGVAAIEDICRELGALAILPAPDEAAREAVWACAAASARASTRPAPCTSRRTSPCPSAASRRWWPPCPRWSGASAWTSSPLATGDGNIHLNLTSPDEAARPRVEAAAEDCVRLALALAAP